MPDPPETKVVRYLDEDGVDTMQGIDRLSFNLWLSNIGSLVKFAPPGSREIEISTFHKVDEFTLYCLENFRADEDSILSHIQNRKLEFGRTCEERLLLETDFSGFDVVKSGEESKEGTALPVNPYAYRFNGDFEVDFYAKKGSEAVAGMFQLTIPEQGEIDAFFNHCMKLNPPATKYV